MPTTFNISTLQLMQCRQSTVQQMSEKRTDSGYLSSSWLSKSADGTTKQTISSSAVSSVRVQCVSEMFTKASVCSRGLWGGVCAIPLASFRTNQNKEVSHRSYRKPNFRTKCEKSCWTSLLVMKLSWHSIVQPQSYSLPRLFYQ